MTTATGIEARLCARIASEGNPAGRIERLRHAYEEALDLAAYLELDRAEAGK